MSDPCSSRRPDRHRPYRLVDHPGAGKFSLAGRIVATDASPPALQEAEPGLADAYVASAAAAVAGSDLVIVCVPIGAYAARSGRSLPPIFRARH